MPNSATAIIDNIMVSFATYLNSTPCIISLRAASTYHLAGIIMDTFCKAAGILSIGNIIPDR